MIRNYLKIAFRHIIKSKVYALINIAGLSIGIACALIIMVYVAGELNYDGFHKDAGRIYRVVRIMPDIHGPSTRNPMAPAMNEDFPEVEQAVRTWKLTESAILEAGNRKFHQSGILFASPGFFRFFTYRFIEGKAANPENYSGMNSISARGKADCI